MLCLLLPIGQKALANPSAKEYIEQEGSSYTFFIADEFWTYTRQSDLCEPRVEAAIDHYWKDQKYRKERDVSAFGYLVNDTSDCWVQLNVWGITGSSILFKMDEDDHVVDSRMMAEWNPQIRPLPKGLIHLE